MKINQHMKGIIAYSDVLCYNKFLFNWKITCTSFHSIGNLLRHWRVHCQWPSDNFDVEPDGDELLDSLVEANDIILEGVVSLVSSGIF